jgi:hypothetical protein
MSRWHEESKTNWTLHDGLLNLMNSSTCFGHHCAHHQELATIQTVPACGTSPWLWQVAVLVHGCRSEHPAGGMLQDWTLWFAQHVSGIIMPIIRSLRLHRRSQRVAPHLRYGRLLVWCMAVGLSVQLEGCCTIEPYDSLNMFRETLCPSSGACDDARTTSLYPDAQTYSHAPDQQSAITKVRCHTLGPSA